MARRDYEAMVRNLRKQAGLPASSASDKIWAQRLRTNTASFSHVRAALASKVNGTYVNTGPNPAPGDPTPSNPPTRTSSPAPGTPAPTSSNTSGGIQNYQRTDQHYAQNESLARERIRAIFRNSPTQPSNAKINAMAKNVMQHGWRYFDTVRHNKERYLTPVNHGDPNAPGMPGADDIPDPGVGDANDDGINDELTVDYNAQARAMYAWLPEELLAEFISHWTQLDNEQAAWGKVRQSGKYDKHFPGIKRDDGSLRMSEQQYLGEIDGIEQAFESFGIPAGTFRKKYHKFIENGQGADQVRRRLATRYTEIASMSDQIRGYYAEKFGTGDISMAAMLASDLDPSMNPLVAEEQFKIAQIGGTGREFGFNMAAKEAERLKDFGMTRQAAQGFFGKAQTLVPTMRELARRHNDPDDTFDITDAADALIFQDPEEVRRLKRLFAAEQSSFTGTGGTVRMGQDGGLAGLRAR